MTIFLYDKKIKNNPDLNVWFYFAGPESFALSSLGFLNMYREIDESDDIDIEMVYSDSKTTRIMLNNVDLIGVSFSFDFDYVQIFSFFEKYKLEIKSSDRSQSDPIIYAGGPVVTSNPEPYSKIFDFLIIGDGEDVNLQVAQIVRKGKLSGKSKDDILIEISKIDGIYVPKFFDISSEKIQKRTKKMSKCLYTPIISEKAFFSNTFIVEVERGCSNRCGFCLASYINLPVRFVPYEQIIDVIELGLKYTNKIALLGAQVTAHPRFIDICKYIENKIDSGENIEMSISSLRVDSFVPEIVSVLVKAGQKNLTLAIEAGSERLRRVINKNITNKQIFDAVMVAKNCGLKGIKLYGMLGLPTETQADIEELVNLTKILKSENKGFNISFGFSTFVPKAQTPFQWFGRVDEKTLEARACYLKKELRKIGVEVSISSLKWDYYQAVLSRGDSSLTDYLIDVYKNGAKLGAYKKSAKSFNIDTTHYAMKTYDYCDNLPWNFIEMNPSKEFLINESKRLVQN